MYNANTKTEQIKVLHNLHLLLDGVNIYQAGDFNLFLNINLEVNGGTPCLKKKCVTKLIQTVERFDLCGIWRLRNPDAKQFTFRQKHRLGFIQRRLYHIFVLNSHHEVITYTDFLAALFLADY